MAITYKTINYPIATINELLAKINSSESFTPLEKSKLTGLNNYDDTDLRSKIALLKNYDDTEIRNLIGQKAGSVHAHNYSDLIGKPVLPPTDTIVTKDFALATYQPKLSSNELTYIGKMPNLESRISAVETKKINYGDILNPPTIPTIPDLSLYALKTEMSTTYQPKLTQLQLADIEKITTISSDVDSLKAKKINYSEIVSPPDLTVYATKESLNSYETTAAITKKLGDYTKTIDLPTPPNLSNYALKADLNNYATTTSLDGKLLTPAQITSINKISTMETSVAKISTIESDVTNLKTKTINYSDIVGPPDLSIYATTTSLSGKLLTQEQVTLLGKVPTLETSVGAKLEYKETTLAAYNNLVVKKPNTLYVIVTA